MLPFEVYKSRSAFLRFIPSSSAVEHFPDKSLVVSFSKIILNQSLLTVRALGGAIDYLMIEGLLRLAGLASCLLTEMQRVETDLLAGLLVLGREMR